MGSSKHTLGKQGRRGGTGKATSKKLVHTDIPITYARPTHLYKTTTSPFSFPHNSVKLPLKRMISRSICRLIAGLPGGTEKTLLPRSELSLLQLDYSGSPVSPWPTDSIAVSRPSRRQSNDARNADISNQNPEVAGRRSSTQFKLDIYECSSNAILG